MAGFTLLAIALFIFIGLFVQASFLLWGARLVGISGRTYGRAIASLILSGMASAALSMFWSGLPLMRYATGSIGGFLINALIMMGLFDTSFGKALGATVIAWALGILVFGGLAVLFVILAGGLAAFA